MESDVEQETGSDQAISESPFDPNKISINIVPHTIGQVIDKLEYDEIKIPDYQRQADLWPQKQKSRFIESLMLNLPIPLFYFAEAEDGKWLVVDGLQRITTLRQFMLAEKQTDVRRLILSDMEFKTEFNGCSWESLPPAMQRRINTSQITINLIGKHTPVAVQHNIFSRINQGNSPLTPQEIRTALFQDYRIRFLKNLVSEKTTQGQAFIAATDNSISNHRQDDLDFATRFLAFYMQDATTYVPDMETFLTEATKNIPASAKRQELINENFLAAMQLAATLFGDKAFRKPSDNDRRNPINKSLFEALSTQLARLSFAERQTLIANKSNFIYEFNRLFEKKDFVTAISSGTAAKEKVIIRHKEINEIIKLNCHA